MDNKNNETRKCNQCKLNNGVKPISEFDGDLQSCRNCLAKRRVKHLCLCGGKYTTSGKLAHMNTKMHGLYEENLILPTLTAEQQLKKINESFSAMQTKNKKEKKPKVIKPVIETVLKVKPDYKARYLKGMMNLKEKEDIKKKELLWIKQNPPLPTFSTHHFENA